MASLWKKFQCFIGAHDLEEVESNTFGIVMQMEKHKCKDCPKTEYYMCTFGGSLPTTKEKYDALVKSMTKVSEVSKGTNAEAMTTHFVTKAGGPNLPPDLDPTLEDGKV